MLAFAAAAAIVGGCSGKDQQAGRLWFVHGHTSSLGMRGKIEAVGRERVKTPPQALGELLQGPTQSERTKGLITAIPKDTSVVEISVSSGTASVRLRSSVSPDMWPSGVYASAQIVYTLTELDNISRVELFVNGQRCLYDMRHRANHASADAPHLRRVAGRPTPLAGLIKRTRIPFRSG
jgi:spore germination protein GerM